MRFGPGYSPRPRPRPRRGYECGCKKEQPWCCPPAPVCLKPKCNVIHRCMTRDVPHVQECHTHIVNHQVNRHHVIPRYTCSEETVCHDEFCDMNCKC
ncbi:CotD family spore coat protein [Haloplasma contractile]|uniref:Inner spore coat D protein n=1 Tax=Haloplasma contractile SSD-17B TaxID=1033810 RepID=U2DZ80_9MOLU|nr:CotD family spore coat protein [Haloplasma contractile]ERJ13512.1 Inner spore coat D protein [Haloplasma contractile SSD-17B]